MKSTKVLALAVFTFIVLCVIPSMASSVMFDNYTAGVTNVSLTYSFTEPSQNISNLSILSSPSEGFVEKYPLMHFTPEQLAEIQRQIELSPKYSSSHIQTVPNGFVSATGSKSLLSYISYVPAERDQGSCGNCWVWASTGALEVDHAVNTGINDRLSIQYFNSKFNNGQGTSFACCGGWLTTFTDWYNLDNTVIPWSNPNASFGDMPTWCGAYQTNVPIGFISITPHYNLKTLSSQTIPTRGVGQATAINNIKSALDVNKAVWYGFFYGNSGWTDFYNFWGYNAETSIFNPDSYANEPSTAGHAVLIVGYDDTVPGSEYWLVLNSWGSTVSRPHDLFRLKMYMNYDAPQYFQILNSNFTTLSAPIANFNVNIASGSSPLQVSFTDLSSNTPTGWAWYFGDETYTAPWTQMAASAGWSGRKDHSSVVMPDRSIVLMGGVDSANFKNDVWRSTNNGATWTQVISNAAWSAREGHSSVVMSDSSIVLMGGVGNDGSKKDVWRSTDHGATWTQMTANAGWTPRFGHTGVAMPDGSIVLMGGLSNGSSKNDVWRSTDKGATWTQMTANAGWSAREGHSSVVMPDGSIVLMGGLYNGGSAMNDVWRSTDNGATWTQVTAHAGWTPRFDHTSVEMPDGSILLMGGSQSGIYKNDVWRSTDRGVTWTQMTANAGWSARDWHSIVVMPDGSIVLMGGSANDGRKNDVWRFIPVGSSVQNPSHTYTMPGIYNVALQAYNTNGYNSTRKIGYITITSPPALTAAFITNTSAGTVPLAVQFTDTSSGGTPAMWNWSFGDGSWFNTTLPSERNPTHIYATAGTYTTHLTISNAGSTSLSSGRTITGTSPPALTAAFITNTSAGTVPLAVQFTDTSIGGTPTMWNWSFGDGSWFNTTLPSERNPTHIYATAGTYTTHLTISNAGSTSLSSGRTITVTSPPALTAAFITNTSSGTVPLAVQFADTSTGGTPTMWNWSFGDGSWFNTTLASERNATHIYVTALSYSAPSVTAGTYTAYLTISNGGSVSLSSGRTITVTSPPALTAAFITNTSSGTVPLAVQFTDTSTGGTPTIWNWSFGDGSWFNTTLASERNATHIYATAGTYTTYLTISNAGSISLSSGRTITVTTTPAAIQIGVFRNSSGNWYLNYNNNGLVDKTIQFGKTEDIPVVDDWYNDGTTNVGVFRPANGNWYLDTTKTGIVNTSFHFGKTEDIPVVGDWYNDGTNNVGVFRSSNGDWYLDTTKTGIVNRTFHFGKTGDVPVVGDWDSNGIIDVGVFRPANGNWYLDTNKTGVVNTSFHFGTMGDIPVVGDWDNNGVSDAGIFRPANGNWYFDTTKTGVVATTFHFGTNGDIPVMGDWDGTGITNVGVFRPSNGNWYLDTTKTGVVNKTFHFGTMGDSPVVGKWI